MWSYGDPFPEFKLVDIKEPEWVKEFNPKSQAFEGFCMLTCISNMSITVVSE